MLYMHIIWASFRNLVIWVNEEDHLRIISMEQGGNLGSVFAR